MIKGVLYKKKFIIYIEMSESAYLTYFKEIET